MTEKEKKNAQKISTIGKAQNLSVKERTFISNYADKNKNTFGNGTQSARYAGIGNTYRSSAAQASKLLKRDDIQRSIDDYLRNAGADIEVRLQTLADIATGRRQTYATTEVTNQKGEKTVTESINDTSNGDVIKANYLVEKLRGTFERQKVQREVISAELRAIMSKERAAFKRIQSPADE